jgi:hypothetical protein
MGEAGCPGPAQTSRNQSTSSTGPQQRHPQEPLFREHDKRSQTTLVEGSSVADSVGVFFGSLFYFKWLELKVSDHQNKYRMAVLTLILLLGALGGNYRIPLTPFLRASGC